MVSHPKSYSSPLNYTNFQNAFVCAGIYFLVFVVATNGYVFDGNGAHAEMAINIDGHFLYVVRNDSIHFGFDPGLGMGFGEGDPNHIHNITASDYFGLFKDKNHTDIDSLDKTDYKNVLKRLIRSAEDEGSTRVLTCLENLDKFRELAENRPLQFVVIVEEGEETRLTCHFCESGDQITETRLFDFLERTSKDIPVYRDPEMIRSPILWYRIRHSEAGKGYRLSEVRPNLHDDDDANRILVTTAHTLVIRKAHSDDAGTYFCQDTRTKDRHIKQILEEWEIKEMLGHNGAFRFLIHLNVLRASDKPLLEDIPEETEQRSYEQDNIRRFFVWSAWTECNTCDQPGQQRSRGVCTLKKIREREESRPWFVNAVLTAQATGVPCRSSLFHTHDTWLAASLYFKDDRFRQRMCHVPCKKKGIFKSLLSGGPMSPDDMKSMVIKDKKDAESGKIGLHIATVNLTEGANITLRCPGAKADKEAVWLNNSRYMPSLTLFNETGGRVSVDLDGALSITYLTPWDRGLYLCAVDGHETGHIFINVTVIVVDEYLKYRAWVLLSLPCDFIVFLFLMIVKHRHRKQILISASDAALYSDSSDEDDNVNAIGGGSSSNGSRNSPEHRPIWTTGTAPCSYRLTSDKVFDEEENLLHHARDSTTTLPGSRRMSSGKWRGSYRTGIWRVRESGSRCSTASTGTSVSSNVSGKSGLSLPSQTCI